MTPIESFAAAYRLSPDDVTHCFLIGRRGDADIYSVGYWGRYSYSSGTINRCGDDWKSLRYGLDIDIERITAQTAAACRAP